MPGNVGKCRILYTQSQTNQHEDHYSNGNLVSLKLHNFMTFDYLDMSAGANLNFVLGPNGTGKSAVVCGLILGLGGEATHTGRPGTLGEYIQFGKQQCSITVELFNDNGRNYVIERTLQHKPNANPDSNRETSIKSDWCLNGKKAKLQQVKDLVSSLNIFTDNLCQFLPQEKVVEFCKLNRQQLLSNTQKAVGNIQMYEDHLKLVELSAEEKKNQEEISTLQIQYERFDQLNQHYEQQVRVIRERKATEEQIQLYCKKKPWLEYEKSRNEYTWLKARANEIERKLQEKKNKLPFDRILIEKNNKLKKLNDKLKDKGQTGHLIRQNEKIRRLLDEFASKQKDEVYKYNMQFKKVREQQTNIDNLNKEIRLLSSQLDSIENEASLKEKASELDDEIKEHVENNTKRHDETFRVKRDQQKVEEKLIQKKTLLKRETNVVDQRMQVLRQTDERLYEITKWLDRNKNQFNGKIFPPMMLSINAKEKAYINLIENLIPKKDMLAFICTDDSDITKFNDLVYREFKHRVSVLTTPDCDLSFFLQRRDERLLDYFDMFASDMFTCPNEILAYLYSQAHLHEIPVKVPKLQNPFSQTANNVSQRNVSQRNSQSNNTPQRNTRRSTQSSLENDTVDLQQIDQRGESITEIRQIQQAKLLCGVQNEDKIREYKQEIVELEMEYQEFATKLAEVEKEFKKEQDCMGEDKGKLNVITNKLNERSKLQHKINMVENQLKTLQEFRIDLDKEKENLSKSLKDITRKKLEMFAQCNKQLEKQYNEDLKLVYDLYDQMQLKKQISFVETLSKKYEEQFQQLENELKNRKEQCKQQKKESDELFKKAHEATNTNPHSNLPKSIKEKFDKIPNSLDELNSEIRKLELKLVFSSDNIDGQDETQRIYTENREQLASTKTKLDDLNKRQESITMDKERLKENWLNEVNKLISQISDKFQVFMRRLNFDGYVRLYKDTNETDYEKYGISVFVRYRDEEECTELDYNKHSGGERNVATMIFIIALQKLTAVPFRVVDEINQGMDDTNERNVMKLIMDLSKEDSSQYFILSPKLVPDLTFNEKCDFQFIFNGAFNFANFKM